MTLNFQELSAEGALLEREATKWSIRRVEFENESVYELIDKIF
jgi:hypothetical protein